MEQIQRELSNWYRINKRPLPWRETTNPYFIWLSEIILQQTRVAQGLPYFEAFVTTFPTVYDFSGSAAIGYQIDVMAFVKRLGQYRSSTSLHKRIGVIVKTPNQKFLINVFLKFAPSFNLELKVFDEAKPCLAWIKEGSNDQEKLFELLNHNKEALAKSLESST